MKTLKPYISAKSLSLLDHLLLNQLTFIRVIHYWDQIVLIEKLNQELSFSSKYIPITKLYTKKAI